METGGLAEVVNFAHNSERQFARLLDFYGLPWEYEPRSFPIAWDRHSKPTQFFTPDFYLPDENVYIEITTMNQKLVTKKNAKVRRLHQLHPDVRCRVLYQRDYLHLVIKYGLEEPAHMETVRAPTRLPGPPRVIRLGEAEEAAG